MRFVRLLKRSRLPSVISSVHHHALNYKTKRIPTLLPACVGVRQHFPSVFAVRTRETTCCMTSSQPSPHSSIHPYGAVPFFQTQFFFPFLLFSFFFFLVSVPPRLFVILSVQEHPARAYSCSSQHVLRFPGSRAPLHPSGCASSVAAEYGFSFHVSLLF